VKHLFYIPPVLVIWRRTTSQTGAFAFARMTALPVHRILFYDHDLKQWQNCEFQVFMAASMKMTDFRDVARCSLVQTD
jgi:hypothetical protein